MSDNGTNEDGNGTPPDGDEDDGKVELTPAELEAKIDEAVSEATSKANAEAAKFRHQRDENLSKLEQLQEATEGKVDESEVEKAAREAAEKAAASYEAKMARKETEAELYRDHGRKFQNPADALAFINIDELDEDTTLDQAVDALLEERPYLAVDETRPSGSGDAGSRTPPADKDPGEMSMDEYREWKSKKKKAGTW